MAAPPSVLVRSLARTCTSSSLTRSTPALARAFRSSPPAAKWRLLPTPSPCPSPASFSPSLIRQLSSTLRSRQQERASSTTTFPHPQSPESLSSATLQSSSTASSASSSSSSFQSRFSSSSSSSSSDGTRPDLSTPAVARWLYFTSFLTFSIVVVGGLTRLTESGLSITEWKPVKGMLPPRGPVEWEDEFAKYRASEEGRIMNAQISLEDFKFIFYMEWAHRNLGRFIGVAFVLPAIYFAARGRLSKRDKLKVLALAGGIGFQGFLGWYMVSSGLDADHLSSRANNTPRVSQYRLAAHLGAALVLYVGMIHTAMTVNREWKFAHGAIPLGFEPEKKIKLFRRGVWSIAGLLLLTAVSGAFVAGLDAGLIYNEFPQMGEGIIPPLPELYDPARYARRTDLSDGWWRNMLENPTTVQFDHRVLATTTALSILTLVSLAHSPLLRRSVSSTVRRFASLAGLTVIAQVTLGITTLLYLVPTPLAAAHQAGSVVLLTAMTGLAVSLRRPGKAAKELRRRLLEGGLRVNVPGSGVKPGRVVAASAAAGGRNE